MYVDILYVKNIVYILIIFKIILSIINYDNLHILKNIFFIIIIQFFFLLHDFFLNKLFFFYFYNYYYYYYYYFYFYFYLMCFLQIINYY